jgi:hypothetical protein
MKQNQQQQSGGTLVVAMIAVLVVSSAIGVAYKTTSATGRLGDRSRDFVENKLAAEGALEYAYGVWKKRVQNYDRAISTTEATSGMTAPTFAGFNYMSAANQGPLNIQATDTYGRPMASASATPAPVIVNLPDYPGWRGRSFGYVASARMQQTAASGGTLSAGVKRRFQYVEVPLFQAMFFYEHDLELYKPATMTVSGLVHSNSNLYLSTGSWAAGALTFQGNVSRVGNYYSANGGAAGTAGNTAPPGAVAWSGGTMYPPTYSTSEAAQVSQVSRYEPLGQNAAAVLNPTDANPNNDSFREIIEPPVTGGGITDPPEIAKRRMYNKAGVIVTINGTTATVTTQNGTTLTPAQVTSIQSAFTGKSTFYDQREGMWTRPISTSAHSLPCSMPRPDSTASSTSRT